MNEPIHSTAELLSETVATKSKDSGPTRSELNKFIEAIAIARQSLGRLAWIEAPRVICEHYNRSDIAGFDSVGYFMFNDVKVFESGKRATAEARDKMNMEQLNHSVHGGNRSVVKRISILEPGDYQIVYDGVEITVNRVGL